MLPPPSTDTADMTTLPTPSLSGAVGSEDAPQGWFAHFVGWTAAARSHRVILLVFSIWLLNAFDLALTVMAHEQGMLHEQNPVARGLLKGGVWSIMLYKIGLVMIGSYPLLRFRRVRITELGALVVLAAYAMLAVRWSACYELYTLTASETINLAELHSITGGSGS